MDSTTDFTKVELNNRVQSSLFIDVFDSDHNIASPIRELLLNAYEFLGDRRLVPLLTSMPNIKILRVCFGNTSNETLNRISWEDLGDPLQNAFYEVFNRLECITIKDIEDVPKSLAKCLLGIPSVTLERVCFIDDKDRDDRRHPASSGCNIKSLSIAGLKPSGMKPFIDMISSPSYKLEKLEVIDVGEDEENMNVARRIITAQGQSLHTLKIGCHLQDGRKRLDVSEIPNLRVLDILLDFDYGEPMTAALSALNTVVDANQLEEIIFHMDYSCYCHIESTEHYSDSEDEYEDEDVEEDDEGHWEPTRWSYFDDVLSERFPRLKRVAWVYLERIESDQFGIDHQNELFARYLPKTHERGLLQVVSPRELTSGERIA